MHLLTPGGGALMQRASPATAAATSPQPLWQQAQLARGNPANASPSPGSPPQVISEAPKAPPPVRRRKLLPPPELPAALLAALDLSRQLSPEERSTAESARRGPHPALQQAHAWLDGIAAVHRTKRTS